MVSDGGWRRGKSGLFPGQVAFIEESYIDGRKCYNIRPVPTILILFLGKVRIKMKRLGVVLLIVLIGVPGNDVAVGLSSTPLEALPGSQNSFGPFDVNGRRCTVVVYTESFAINDNSGRALYRRDLPSEVESGWTATVSAQGLEGANWRGILLRHSFSPSAPGDMDSIQIFAERGQTVAPLSPPLGARGFLEPLQAGDGPGSVRLLEGDTFIVVVWVGRFGVRVSFQVDAVGGQVAPVKLSGRFDPYLEGNPSLWQQVGGTVRLYPDVHSETAPVEAIISQNSEIRFTDCFARLRWTPTGSQDKKESLWIGVEEAFLKVAIDGTEGWVKHPGDLLKLGLREAG